MQNRIVLNSGGRYSNSVDIDGILVNPSADAWSVVWQDSKGIIIFTASGKYQAPFYAPITVSADACNMTTATNISNVVLY